MDLSGKCVVSDGHLRTHAWSIQICTSGSLRSLSPGRLVVIFYVYPATNYTRAVGFTNPTHGGSVINDVPRSTACRGICVYRNQDARN